MSLVTDVEILITNSNLLRAYINPDNVSSFKLPEELINKTNENVVLVGPIGSRRSGYAGDYSTKKLETCQVQIWFKNGNEESSNEKMEMLLIQLLEKNHIYNRQSSGLDEDPDTQQLFLTLSFWREKKEIIICY